jgi:hypothetical protein
MFKPNLHNQQMILRKIFENVRNARARPKGQIIDIILKNNKGHNLFIHNFIKY